MQLCQLTLNDFKNIEGASLDMSPKINCFVGDNGMGKSNLLDAIYYLGNCRSFTGATDAMLVRRDAPFAALRAVYHRRDLDEELQVGIRPGQRKIFKRNGKAYQRLAEHLGTFPAVLLSPADMELTGGEPSERRRFIDQIIAQREGRYFEALVRYNGALEQRNRLLRDEVTDTGLYEALEAQLEMAGEFITARRRANIAELESIFMPYYQAIADGTEEARLEYVTTEYPDGLAARLAAMRGRDMALHHTASGPHRDDIAMTVDGMPVRRTASQGQAKTFTTALRFAQYELLRKSLGIRPLLLLDDIFDKLDAGRVERIIALVGGSDTFGQIFITDTNRRHLDETVASLGATGDYRLWQVERGTFTPIQA